MINKESDVFMMIRLSTRYTMIQPFVYPDSNSRNASGFDALSYDTRFATYP